MIQYEPTIVTSCLHKLVDANDLLIGTATAEIFVDESPAKSSSDDWLVSEMLYNNP